MTTFTYKARTSQGEVVQGTQEAPSEGAAAQTLKEQGYWVTELRPQKGAASPPGESDSSSEGSLEDLLFGEASSKELALFYRQMAASIHAGIGVSRSVELAMMGTTGRLRRAFDPVMRQTANGVSLSEAMEARRRLFGPLAVAFIRVGETAGRLEESLKAAASHFERRWKLQQQIQRAMVYPAFLLLALIFIPALPVAVLQGAGAAARLLLFQFLALAQLVVAYFAFRAFIRSKRGREWWDTLLIHVPMLGGYLRKAASALFLRTFADLYDVGIGPLTALDIAAETCGNRYLGRNLLHAKPALEAGEPLSAALGRTGMLPPIAMQMLVTGETSGSVGFLLNKVADYMEGEVETATTSFMKVLPVLLWAVIAIPIILSILQFWGGYASR